MCGILFRIQFNNQLLGTYLAGRHGGNVANNWKFVFVIEGDVGPRAREGESLGKGFSRRVWS
jgi:hypothetical protein